MSIYLTGFFIKSGGKIHYLSTPSNGNREANFSGFRFIPINDKFGPIYRGKFNKIRKIRHQYYYSIPKTITTSLLTAVY